MKLTKHKTGIPGIWKIRADGADLPYTIEKGDCPKFGMRQEWHVCEDQWPLFTTVSGCDGALQSLENIINAALDAKRDAA